MGSTSATIQLSPARIRLVEILRAIYFGRIEHLVVRAAEPVLDRPEWEVVEPTATHPAYRGANRQ